MDAIEGSSSKKAKLIEMLRAVPLAEAYPQTRSTPCDLGMRPALRGPCTVKIACVIIRFQSILIVHSFPGRIQAPNSSRLRLMENDDDAQDHGAQLAPEAQPAPSTSASPIGVVPVNILLWTRASRLPVEPLLVPETSSADLLASVQNVEQVQAPQAQTSRRSHRGYAPPLQSVGDNAPIPRIPCVPIPRLFPSLPELHPENRAALEKMGLFPFDRGQKFPFDRNLVFPELIDIDAPGDIMHLRRAMTCNSLN